jgi:hypothetical protein
VIQLVTGDKQVIPVKVAVLETESFVPILLGMPFLEQVGAVIDFNTGNAKFKNIDPERIVKLEKIQSGHYVFDLATGL